MLKRKQTFNKGITLIALVITIIILLILAGITITSISGENGVLKKADNGAEENRKQTATEKINLKITNIQIETYGKKQQMPSLQELADGLCEDEKDEIEYVFTTSQKEQASLDKIEIGEATSIFTKLREYPYEFEINSSLQLASIDNIKIATNSSEIEELRGEIENLKNTVEVLKTNSKTTLIEREWGIAKGQISSSWCTLDEVSLAGHGTGKAIISGSISNTNNKSTNIEIEIDIDKDGTNHYKTGATDRCSSPTNTEWLRTSATAIISYNENTKIQVRGISHVAIIPCYTYSILLIPD